MGRWEDKYVIGLTGNIATGKSLVRRMLEHLGAYTIDADGLAHQAMAPGAPAYKPVVLTFGQWILDAERRIDRGRLGAVVFAHPDALRRLEALTHPIVIRAIDTLISRARQKVVVVEAIKLLETPLAERLDAIWVVDADEKTQVERLAKRGLDREAALKRIRLQNPQAEKLARADVIIYNQGTPDDTWAQVRAAWLRVQALMQQGDVQELVRRVEVAPSQQPPGQRAISSIDILRGMPHNADQIAALLQTRNGGQRLSRDDVIMALGQKSYMMAVADGRPLGLVGFLVENLVTRVDELFLLRDAPVRPTVAALIGAVEEASRALQSEIGYIFLPENTGRDMVESLLQQGYQHMKIEEIKVPAWREAARESRPAGTAIFAKKLRAERVLKPL
ncbi:MAG: dephospho-CoA kinase [Chloroflexota bacterium]|nr:dephospho-CoA kinase [Anaerolineae bacterium]